MEAKVCSKCGIEKPFNDFYFKFSKPIARCKSCTNTINRNYYTRTIKERRLYDASRSGTAVPRHKKFREKIKRECFSHYCIGDIKCDVCEIDDFEVLTLDHINGGGRKMSREIGLDTCSGSVGGYRLYLYLKRNNYPKGFRVLCFNCQHKEAKRLGFFVTKHQRRTNRK